MWFVMSVSSVPNTAPIELAARMPASVSDASRRIIAAVQPLYEKYDVVLAAGFGPAPRLDSHRTVNFWQKTNVFTPSNVFGGPSLALPNGMSGALPLGNLLSGPAADRWGEPVVLVCQGVGCALAAVALVVLGVSNRTATAAPAIEALAVAPPEPMQSA